MPRNKQFDEQIVLDKALQLFWKQGYSATSVQDLVTTLGINRASLYTAFGDKEQLFNRAFQHYITINKVNRAGFFDAQPDVRTGFQILFKQAISESCDDPDKKGCFVVNTTTELVPKDAYLLKIVQLNKATIESQFLAFLEKGEQENQFPKGKDLKSIATLLFTLLSGLKVVSKMESNPEALSLMVNTTLSLLD